MAKVTIELDVPEAIMKLAMDETSVDLLKEMCQAICQAEFNEINRKFLKPFYDLSREMIKDVEEKIKSGKIIMYPGTPLFLQHIFNMVKDEGSSLEDEIREHTEDLREWANEHGLTGKSQNPFDSFEGLLREDKL